MNTTIDILKDQLTDVRAAAEGESNDAEIEALRDACETGLRLLGRNFDDEQGDEDSDEFEGFDYDEQTTAYEADQDGDEIARLARATRRAQYGDSNDKEIEVYGALLDAALDALGITREGTAAAVEG